mgnify:CR=1 FL=1
MRGFTLFALLAGLIVVMGGLPILKGGFYLGKHEGDTLHLAELVLRMADGQWPHLDFMTPIGYLAIAPIAWFVKAGAGMGHAIFYAQIAVALVLLPAVMRVALSRLPGLWAYAYGALLMIFCLALVHGEAQVAVSISMHYNRWAWAIAYIVLPLAILAPLGRPRPWLDGTLIGLGLAVLVLMKVTYFVSIAPAILIALLARRDWKAIVAAAIAGLLVAAAMTVAAGIPFWFAYLADLRTVAGSEIRAAPGEDFSSIISAPLYMGASMALLAAVILLRQSGRAVEGLALLIAAPGFVYITYQNFGNDPQWLPMLVLFAFLLRPEAGEKNGFGWDLRHSGCGLRPALGAEPGLQPVPPPVGPDRASGASAAATPGTPGHVHDRGPDVPRRSDEGGGPLRHAVPVIPARGQARGYGLAEWPDAGRMRAVERHERLVRGGVG